METNPTSNVIYTVTVIDDSVPFVPDYRRTPAIFTDLDSAVNLVKTNEANIAESGQNGYAVIEQTLLNKVLPPVKLRMWFEWNQESEAYEFTETPSQFTKVRNVALS